MAVPRPAAGAPGLTARAAGPIPQRDFLHGLGLEMRLEGLLANADAAQAETLKKGYARLVGPGEENGMGEVYKAWALTSPGLGGGGAPVPFVFFEDDDGGEEGAGGGG